MVYLACDFVHTYIHRLDEDSPDSPDSPDQNTEYIRRQWGLITVSGGDDGVISSMDGLDQKWLGTCQTSSTRLEAD